MALFSYGGVIQKFQKGQRPCLARRKDRRHERFEQNSNKRQFKKIISVVQGASQR